MNCKMKVIVQGRNREMVWIESSLAPENGLLMLNFWSQKARRLNEEIVT